VPETLHLRTAPCRSAAIQHLLDRTVRTESSGALLTELMGRLDTSKERLDPAIDSHAWLDLHLSPYLYAAESAEGLDVLDVGCSHGYGTAALAEVARSAVGFDLYPEVIRRATTEFGRDNLRFLVHDANDPFPFQDESFDLVFSSEVIEHVREQDLCVGEMARVLRPGGTLILKTPNRPYARKDNPFHTHEFLREELDELLRRHFGCVRVGHFGLHPVWGVRKVELPQVDYPQECGPPIPVPCGCLIEVFLRPDVTFEHKDAGADLLARCRKAEEAAQ